MADGTRVVPGPRSTLHEFHTTRPYTEYKPGCPETSGKMNVTNIRDCEETASSLPIASGHRYCLAYGIATR